MLRLPHLPLPPPTTLPEAAAILAGDGAGEGALTRVVAGGTDLWPNMKRRHQKAATVVSLMRIPELRGIGDGGELRLGATATLRTSRAAISVRDALPRPRRGGGFDLVAAAAQHGDDRRQRLPRHPLHLLQPERGMAALDRLLHEGGGHDLLGGARVAALLGDLGLGFGADAVRARGQSDVWSRATASARSRSRRSTATTASTTSASGPTRSCAEIRVPASSGAEHCRSRFLKLRRRGSIDFAVLAVAAAVWTTPDGAVRKARMFSALWLPCPLPRRSSRSCSAGRSTTRASPTPRSSPAEAPRPWTTPTSKPSGAARWSKPTRRERCAPSSERS